MPSLLGEKIRGLRKQRGLSLEQLAEQTESSKSYIWELENKDNPKPSAEKIARIAGVLKVTPEYFMDDRITELEPSEEDKAFFRKYRGLSSGTKKKLDDILKIIEGDDK
ncbi:MAG: transcriptional regulator [Gammaproteobacteria bacterium]|nr:transcriptional regulator [Gammaproteobacteria bacterium]